MGYAGRQRSVAVGAEQYAGGDWRAEALCARESPDLFFPLGHSDRAVAQAEAAKQVCGRCAVKQPCLAWALQWRPAEGVFGGTDPDERRALLRRR